MTSFIPGDIGSCWEYIDAGTNERVKVCNVTGASKEIVPRMNVVSSKSTVATPSAFKDMHVKKCDPKKDNKCDISVGGNFYKACNPKKDKKCKINLDDILFSDII